MEILVAILLVLAVSAIALAAKHGAEAAQTRRDERWGGLSSSPPLRPPEAAPAPSVRAAVSSGAGWVQRALRRTDEEGNGASSEDAGDRPATGRGSGSVSVAPSRAVRERGAPAPSRAEEAARRAVGSAAENATSTARAVRATASAALRRQPAPIDINTAPVSDLQNLPGVGIRAAQRIVAHRESHGGFSSVEDLGAVEGFDQHRVSRLAPRATV